MAKYATNQIRNVALLGHTGAGKTSLGEAMLYRAGVVSRLGRVQDGTTTSDYEPEEVKRQISINLSLLPFAYQDTWYNLIDTPGYADFVGEVEAALRVAEGVIIVVCAASGVEVGTEHVWQYAEELGLPRLIFVNKMDRENANFHKTLGKIEATFGRRCLPLHLPLGAERGFRGIFDLVGMTGEEQPPEADQLRERLVEAAAEADDELITKYLEGEELSEGEVRRGLRSGVLEGRVVPVLAGSVLQDIGIPELLAAIQDYLPSPGEGRQARARNLLSQEEETLEPSEGGPLSALVFKTTADPYVGRLTYLKVLSGVLYSDSSIWNATRGRPERIGQLYRIRGKNQEPVAQIAAGDIGAVAKLAETGTGDSLSHKDRPLLHEPFEFPHPVLTVAVHPKTKIDLDKLGPALSRLVEEDPTLEVRKEPDTAETLLSGMGDVHLEVVAEKMKRKFGVEVKTALPRIPYKETVTTPVKVEYKHKKQTGGHGQYGHVFLELEPLPRGSGAEFVDRVVGGAVPRNYIPAVEKGVYEALQEGDLAGCPVVDIRVTLYDGSSHPVDSSDMAFKIAASHALRKGVSQGQPVLLEPIMNVRVTVPESFTGDIIGDLNGKRARVLGMTPQDGSNVIEAQAPLAELQHYATALRSLTQGRGTQTMQFSHYEEMPQHIAQRIVEQAKKESEKA